MRLLITICARGGSKGIPGKNIKPVGGKPLIAYTIAHAQRFAEDHSAEIILSTEDAEIRQAAATYGLLTDYERPEELATDEAGKIAVIADALHHAETHAGREFEFVLDLDVSSPMRTQRDLAEAFDRFRLHEDALSLLSVSPARRNPYFNMVEKDDNDFIEICKPPSAEVLSRQSAPEVFELNASFHFYRRPFFETAAAGPTISHRSLAYLMPHICFDLDDPLDFEFLGFLIRDNKLPFQL